MCVSTLVGGSQLRKRRAKTVQMRPTEQLTADPIDRMLRPGQRRLHSKGTLFTGMYIPKYYGDNVVIEGPVVSIIAQPTS